MLYTSSRRPAGPFELRRPARRDYRHLTLQPQGISIGAEVSGVDLRTRLDEEIVDELRAALRDWKVLFFRDQRITAEQHAALARHWGRLVDDQLVLSSADRPVDNVVEFTRDASTTGLENEWHSDGTFRPMPTLVTVLRAVEVPEVGGDTIFADVAAAFDNLSDDVRTRILRLSAIHDWSIGAYADKYGDRLMELRAQVPPIEHPVVIAHPDTGRPTLLVNRLFTREIIGLSAAESSALLDTLCAMVERPELQCRFRWEPGSIAIWDNIACNHYGVNDYFPERRVMARATVFDEVTTQLQAARDREFLIAP